MGASVPVRVRFAPSPTGYLHVGGARTALYNYLFARVHGGTFVLRIEDTDAARSTEESVRAILDSLRWLGLAWDEGPGVGGSHGPYFQAERRERYQAHAEALRAAGRAYPCFCAPVELEERRAKAAAEGLPAQGYDGRCRQLDEAARARLAVEGRVPALRFAHDAAGETAWDDVVRGHVAFRNDVLEDFVLLRPDGLPTYNFACVVDDHEMEITHVIRGDDHISNTPRQLVLYRALGWEPPAFAHVSMILGADGSRLSKRHGATSVAAYHEMGYVPEAMVNFLALLGWSLDDKTTLFTLPELERVFSLERVSRNPAVFDLQKLEWMNGQHLKRLPEEERVARATAFLAARGVDLSRHPAEWWAALVRVLGERVRTLADLETLGAFALEDEPDTDPVAWGEVQAKPEVDVRLEALAAVLEPDAEWSHESLERVTRGLAAERGWKPGELMSSARVALTGRKTSPGLFDVMGLLGHDRTLARLRAAANRWRAESVRPMN
jgi:glutamyl-tRNA synthetase